MGDNNEKKTNIPNERISFCGHLIIYISKQEENELVAVHNISTI